MLNQRLQFIFLFLSVAILSSAVHAQQNPETDLSQYQKKFFADKGDTLLYRVLYPQNFDPSKKYPLIVFLHGSGERGNDNEKQLAHGAKLFLRSDIRRDYPAIVIFPQCPEKVGWANYRLTDSSGKRNFVLMKDQPPTIPMLLLEKLIDDYKNNQPVNKKRIYVGGLSMGGMGTFEITRRNPKLFAAAFPICGAADASSAKSLRKMGWWIFHGAKDDVVPPGSSIEMAAALKKEKAKVRFTLYPEANHNSWDSAFAEKDLMPWMFSQHK
jgi:predicted peptidase